MWWGVLGPLAFCDDSGTPFEVPGRVRRRVLAALIARANHTVAPATLIEDVWGTAAPRSAAKTLQSHVVRLRDDLGRGRCGAALLTDRSGYRLAIKEDECDALQFGALAHRVLTSRDRSAPSELLGRCDDALALWRGEAYEDLPDAEFAVAERLRLGELREAALDARAELCLDLGQSAALVPELRRRVAATPFRERVWELLALALYRSGRQAEALDAITQAREVLDRELGVDPGPGLQGLQVQILQHDPALASGGDRRPEVRLTQPSTQCPYRGLAGYGAGDAAVFVGRDRLIAQLVGRLADQPVVVVTGSSGAGKSSLLRAGLVPALRAGALPGSAAWRVTVTDKARIPEPGSADLVIVDQAEELFTVLDPDAAAEAGHRLNRLTDAGCRVVLVIRADFYGRLAELSPLAAYASAAIVLVGPLRTDEVRAVVTVPARRAGLDVEPELVEDVLDDLEGQPAALPMLSVALVRAWQNREGTRITRDAYRRGGGVARALEQAAEDAFALLDAPAQQAARQLLVRLATRDGSAWTRRAVSLSILDDFGSDGRRALTALTEARLLTVGDSRLEIVHDALLEGWPRLRGWLEERAAQWALAEHLDAAAVAWDRGGRRDSDLYRGARLQAALDWRRDHPQDVPELHGVFLDAAAAAAEGELVKERARADREAAGRRRLRFAVAAVAAVAAVLLVVGAVALVEKHAADLARRRASTEAVAATAGRLAAVSLTAPDFRTSLLLAAAAYRMHPSTDTSTALLASLEKNGSALTHIATSELALWVGGLPDGHHVLALNRDRVLTRWDLRTGRASQSFAIGAFRVSALSPDGEMVVVSGTTSRLTPEDRPAMGVLDAGHGSRLWTLPIRALDRDHDAAFTGDGRALAVIEASRRDPGTPAAAVAVFDRGGMSQDPRTLETARPVVALAASVSDIVLLTEDGTIEDVRARDLHVLRKDRLPELAERSTTSAMIAASPTDDSVAVVTAERPDLVQMIRFTGRSATVRPAEDVGAPVTAMTYSPDGSRIAVGTELGGVEVLDRAGELSERLAGQDGRVYSATWLGRGSRAGLVTAAADGDLVTWDLTPQSRLVHVFGPSTPPDSGDFLLGNTTDATTAPGGSTALQGQQLVRYDLRAGRRRTVAAHIPADRTIFYVDGDRTGRRVLLTEYDRSSIAHCEIWDLLTGRRVASFVPTRSPSTQWSYGAALSPDGRTAAISTSPYQVSLFALPSGRRERTIRVVFPGAPAGRIYVTAEGYGPDGRVLIAGYDPGPSESPDGTPYPGEAPQQQHFGLLDLHTGRLTGDFTFPGTGVLDAMRWSPSGDRLALASDTGRLAVLDAATMRPLANRPEAETGFISAVSWSPDGNRLLTSSSDHTLTLFDPATLRPLAAPLRLTADSVFGNFDATTGDIRGLIVVHGKQRFFTMPGSPDAWARMACRIAGTPLTKAEWRQYAGDLPYRAAC